MTERNDQSHREQPTYWFAILEIARNRGDGRLAAEATRELKRLGVHVEFDDRRKAAHA